MRVDSARPVHGSTSSRQSQTAGMHDLDLVVFLNLPFQVSIDGSVLPPRVCIYL